MDENFNKKRVVGDNAESIFAFLISSMPDWKLIKFGIENHIDDLKKKLRENHTSIAEKIKYMPDFVIINEKENKVIFIEVKSTVFVDKREQDKLVFQFQKNLIEKYMIYWDEVKLFVVHHQDPYFYVVDLKDVNIEKHKIKGEFFSSSRNSVDNKRPMNRWNFKDVQKGIKEIFPELKDETITEASKMIMKTKPEEKS